MKGFRDLTVYEIAFKLAMEIYKDTANFPKEEKYSLVDQLRRSSRSVCANIGEGYRKRNYPKAFSSSIIIANGEASETTVHLEFAKECGYITSEKYSYFLSEYDKIGGMLSKMSDFPEKFMPSNFNKRVS